MPERSKEKEDDWFEAFINPQEALRHKRGRNDFFEDFPDAPAPNEAAMKAAKRYKKLTGRK